MLTVPTSTKLVPTVPVEVAIWSLGYFRLKGVSELIKVSIGQSLKFLIKIHSIADWNPNLVFLLLMG